MVSTLQHFIWGYIIYSIAGYDPTNYFLLIIFLFLSQFLDIDWILKPILKLKHHHRFYFHNIFASCFFLFLLSFILDIFLKFNFLEAFVFTFLAFFTHLILDLFDEVGVPLLYPFKRKEYLIYKVCNALPFPIKVIYGGNIWFLIISLILFLSIFLLNYSSFIFLGIF